MRGMMDLFGRRARRELDLRDPRDRRRAGLHLHLVDHGLLRHHWTNMDEVAPGAWRMNHPTEARLRDLKARGIRAVLNLRGETREPHHLLEREWCDALGLALVSVSLQARKAPKRRNVLALFEAFRAIERPFVMHCKSGADRAGFASALLLLQQGEPLAVARRQLSFRYLHVRSSRTGVLDHILDLYEARLARGPIGVEEWFATEYDHEAAQAGFDR